MTLHRTHDSDVHFADEVIDLRFLCGKTQGTYATDEDEFYSWTNKCPRCQKAIETRRIDKILSGFGTKLAGGAE